MQGLALITRIYCQKKAKNAQKEQKNDQKSALFGQSNLI